MKPFTLSNRGMSLIMVLVATTLSSILFLFILSMGRIALGQQKQSSTFFQADQIRRNLVAYLENENAWTNTLSDPSNTNLACLKAGTDCSAAGGAFRIRDAANNLVYDPLSTTEGFTGGGEACDTFDAVNGNPACPFRMELTWTPICTTGCLNPQVKIDGKMFYKPAAGSRKLALNANTHGIHLVRGAMGTDTFSQVYITLGGTSANMVADHAQVDCPAGTKIVFASVYYARADNYGNAVPAEQICYCGIKGNGVQVTQQDRFAHTGKGCGCTGLCFRGEG